MSVVQDPKSVRSHNSLSEQNPEFTEFSEIFSFWDTRFLVSYDNVAATGFRILKIHDKIENVRSKVPNLGSLGSFWYLGTSSCNYALEVIELGD